jgi:hypothetical protein
MTTVTITKGQYRDIAIANQTFELVKAPKSGKKGMFVTVNAEGHANLPARNIRITVESAEMVRNTDEKPSETVEPTETDEQVIERLRERFDILTDMAEASVDGVVRGLVVTGPPGVGKSFGVEQVLDEAKVASKIQNSAEKYGVVKGASSAIGLYKTLYEYADAGSVLVLDDCDTVLYDETSLNLLKAALDSSKKRKLSWLADSALLRREGIPDTFEFRGSVIFITNLKFENTRGKLKDHLNAILSRCHYLDLTMDTMREKFLRCKQITADGMLNEYGFDQAGEDEVLNFIETNQHRLRELSLRMVTKVADLRKMNPAKWKLYAESTCMRRA